MSPVAQLSQLWLLGVHPSFQFCMFKIIFQSQSWTLLKYMICTRLPRSSKDPSITSVSWTFQSSTFQEKRVKCKQGLNGLNTIRCKVFAWLNWKAIFWVLVCEIRRGEACSNEGQKGGMRDESELAYLVASGTISVLDLVAILRILIRNCVILVSLCLFLCTRNLGQYCRCSSICSKAWSYRRFSLDAAVVLPQMMKTNAR